MEKLLNQKIDEYFDKIVLDTQEFIKIKSVLDEKSSNEKAPFGHEIDVALRFVLERGKKLGLKTKNVDGYVGYIEIGTGLEMVGILGHVDVVPEGKGWSVDPYDGEIRDGKLYGRGSIDDKGPIMACLYALKAIQESGLPTKKRARLIVGTDEETSGRCIKYYLQKEEKPVYGFSPDGNFPIIYAEKGIIRFEIVKEFKANDMQKPTGSTIKSIKGGSRVNVVPDYAEAYIQGLKLDIIQNKIREKGLESKLAAENIRDGVLIKANGVSAHAMQPEEGLNAIQLLMEFLKCLDFGPLEAKQLIDAISSKLKMETDGELLGIACQDEISGNLTFNTGIIDVDDKRAVIKFDIRYPVTEDANKIIQRLKKSALEAKAQFNMLQHKPPLHVDKDSFLIKKLQHVYKEMTNEDPVLISIGGGTYCRYVENTVSFGPVFPGQKELAHQKDEHVRLQDLNKMAKIYAQAIYELIK